MNKFTELNKNRLYAMHKDIQIIFHFILDSGNNMRIITGPMTGYVIVPENQCMFSDPEYTCIDIGEAPTIASLQVGVSKGRPRTPD